jgi:hypothetical protein
MPLPPVGFQFVCQRNNSIVVQMYVVLNDENATVKPNGLCQKI